MTQKKSTKKSAQSRTSTRGKKSSSAQTAKTPRRREIGALICLLLAVFSFISFFTASGAVIDFLRVFLRGLLGSGFYALPFSLLLCAATLSFHRGRPVVFRVVSALLLPVIIAATIHLFGCKYEYEINPEMLRLLWLDSGAGGSGGALGGFIAEGGRALFSMAGAAIVFIALLLFFALSALNKTLPGLIDTYRSRERREYVPVPAPPPPASVPEQRHARPRRRKNEIDIPIDDFPDKTPHERTEPYNAYDSEIEALTEAAEPVPPRRVNDIPLDIPFMEQPKKRAKKQEPSKLPEPETFAEEIQDAAAASENPEDYVFPPLSLLAPAESMHSADGTEEVRMNTERLELAFRSFGVNVRITNATRGPSVTLYEAELEAGVKLARLTGLADDIALSLGVEGVRIGPVPNRISTVGIEVPNGVVSTVYLRELFEAPEFKNAKSKLTFAIGKNIAGEAILGNIAKLPHLLVAGTTGSGKSVCLNSLILSILYKATPEEVRFIMIDPKMVEFRVYNGIPHLLVPVVTDVKKAAGALQWAVIEMMRRYKMFSEKNARDLESYNKLLQKEDEKQMPQIVVIIDELADLMMTAAKDVEESVCRVAQMGRAAGVHLVIATQSPRADVITGLMKANIPSRIALKVSSSLESRIILDAGGGADKLVGNGDMLFAPIGSAKPTRVQGAFVTDPEREAVVDFVKNGVETEYSEEIISEIERAAEAKNGKSEQEQTGGLADYDEMLPQAAELILEAKKASTTMLQTRLKLGYARAARIIDQLEQIGFLGPFEGSKPRQILLTREQWFEMQTVQGTAPIGASGTAPQRSAAPALSEADEPEDGVPFSEPRYEDDDEDDLPPF